MDVLNLARLQFAVTTVYHFFFVPLTLGLSIIVALMQTLYVRTNREVYKDMTKFWGKLFVINFAMGVVTGIVQEFQFGMNWSEYSRFVGDIFGAPLAIEALLAFFLESTFLGLWIFGWDKLSKRVHLLSIWLVAIASNLSALWILIANSFMQQPVGYEIVNGRAQMTDFFAVVFNPNIWTQFPHVIASGLATAAFFILGISTYHLLRPSQDNAVFQRSFQIAAIVGILGTVGVIMSGHSQMQHLVTSQPMKVAASEALWNTEDPAGLSVLTIGNLQGEEVFSIRIPNLLSLLALDQLQGTVRGLNDLQAEYEQTYGPGDYTPPVFITYWSFRGMVGAGILMLVANIYALLLVMGEQLGDKPKFLRFFIWFIPLPYIANTTGWLMTEFGRFPWIVYGLMKLDEGVSISVSIGMVALSLVGFTLIYAALIAANIYLMVKFARGSGTAVQDEASTAQTAVSLIGD
ncbi:MAG: cytochrome ubiquinol oxidase subunit I [Ardenticatenaceae bacterium]|nr:cytochrome ubiquinol oxidase subunit I [Ardenticatenaceae bacterium]